MRCTNILRQIKPAVRSGRSSPGKSFDDNFVIPQRKKAWEGQDKDQYFRDKYAHVHARQRKDREEKRKVKSEYKESKSFTRNKLRRYEHALETGSRVKSEPNILLKRREQEEKYKKASPKSFAQKLAESFDLDPRREFLYGTGPVKAALESGQRDILKLYTRESKDTIDKQIQQLCSNPKKKLYIPIEYNVGLSDLNIMTHNGVHNKYVMEVRPLNTVSLAGLGAFNPANGMLDVETAAKNMQAIKVGSKHRKFPLALFVDEVTDVHNTGAILRSALYLGVNLVVRSEKNCAQLNPVVSKSSAGALEYMQLYNASKPLQFFEKCVENGWNIVATTPSTAPGASKAISVGPSELCDLVNEKPTMLVVGSEGEGLRTSLLQRSTHVVSWKGLDKRVDSLNVSVATALLLSKFYKSEAFD